MSVIANWHASVLVLFRRGSVLQNVSTCTLEDHKEVVV